MENWQNYNFRDDDLVLSSRIRIARNIKNKPFPHKMEEVEARKVVELIESAFYISTEISSQYKTILLWNCEDNNRNNFFEKHLISAKLIKNRAKSAFILSKDETVSIMLNEEDHIRLQCISGGLNLRETYDNANNLDNLIEENTEYAFDERLGYITACPTNIGTALRASVMIHLPALTLNDEMNGILKVLTQVGMTVRGIYGEGSQAQGNIYQISNQITLGTTEEDILSNLETVVNQIINQEYITREKLVKSYKYDMEDKIYRSQGILETAVLLNSNECMDLLSNVRMGVEMGIINNISKNTLNSLLVDTQLAAMQIKFNSLMSEKERDFNRAMLVRTALKSGKIDNNHNIMGV